jgi:hypothetical protein
MATSSVQGGRESDEDSLNEEEMGLFMRRYNLYIKINGLKHNDKNLVDFRKASLNWKRRRK